MSFTDGLKKFVYDSQQKAKDGITFAEAAAIVQDAIALGVQAAADLQNSGLAKKTFVLNFVGEVFDVLAPAIPFPGMLAILTPFRPLIRPLARQLVLAAADGAIETIYKRFVKQV